MRPRPVLATIACVAIASASSSMLRADEKSGVNWPSFRGPGACGIAEGFPTPTKWNAKKDKNILWKQAIPGLGHSSPIIWGDRLFVTTAVSDKGDQSLKVGLYGDIESVNDDSNHSWWVYCLDKHTGKILWKQQACKGVPKIKRHTKASHANSTPATDGGHVVAFFGSEGLYCYDMDGKPLWEKDLGVLDSGYYVVPDAQWEFGSSPVIHDGKVIVQCDIQKNSFVMALDVKDGKVLWLTPRKEVPTWSTPTVHVGPDRAQVILNGYKHIGGYDLADGKELWKMRGLGDIPVPTPVVVRDLIYVTNGHGMGQPIYAIKTSATGDITLRGKQTSNEHVAWNVPMRGNYMQTPLIYEGHFYGCMDSGILSCFDARTGKEVYRNRIGRGLTGFTASPVAADGKLYFTSEEGDIYVVKAGPTFKQLARNRIGEVCMATPAISEGALYFRTQNRVICVAEKDRGAAGEKIAAPKSEEKD